MSEQVIALLKKPTSEAIADHSIHEMLLICIGLEALLWLQYTNEGHLDHHVRQLFNDVLHICELRYANDSQTDSVDPPPF